MEDAIASRSCRHSSLKTPGCENFKSRNYSLYMLYEFCLRPYHYMLNYMTFSVDKNINEGLDSIDYLLTR